MSLYIVIYIAGSISGTVGPLPYGEATCNRRVAEMMAGADHGAATPEGLTTKDVRLVCEWHSTRPKNER